MLLLWGLGMTHACMMNKKRRLIFLKSIDSSYEYEMMLEHISHMIFSPIVEFEKVLDVLSPIVVQVPDMQTCNYEVKLPQ